MAHREEEARPLENRQGLCLLFFPSRSLLTSRSPIPHSGPENNVLHALQVWPSSRAVVQNQIRGVTIKGVLDTSEAEQV